MKLNSKIKYGLLCLHELASQSGQYLNAESIALRHRIPPAYAHKILQKLAQVGLIDGQRGSGYRLSRPLSLISVLEVVNALGKDEEKQPSYDIVSTMERHIQHALQGINLESMQKNHDR